VSGGDFIKPSPPMQVVGERPKFSNMVLNNAATYSHTATAYSIYILHLMATVISSMGQTYDSILAAQ
jgi:hypothetical protein